MMQFEDLLPLAEQVIGLFSRHRCTLSTAESCTGGLVSAALTAIPGSSAVLERGFVTYSNQAKQDLLGVPAALLEHYGAVSQPTAQSMAAGACRQAGTDFALSITGIAGPGGGSADKPVGLVHFGWAVRDGSLHGREQIFDGDRSQIRMQAAAFALHGLLAVFSRSDLAS